MGHAMRDDPPIRKSNGFALQRKPNGGRITLNADVHLGNLGYPILIGGHESRLEKYLAGSLVLLSAPQGARSQPPTPVTVRY
jgi:hypothetical protein